MYGPDPESYLTDGLERMVSGRTTNDRLHELLAWNWRPDRRCRAIPKRPHGSSIGPPSLAAGDDPARDRRRRGLPRRAIWMHVRKEDRLRAFRKLV